MPVPQTAKFMRATKEARMPDHTYPGDAGYDLYVSRPVRIAPGEWVDVHTDIHVELPEGVWAEIVGRSSTFRKRGIQVQQGVIDNGYTGEMFIACWNTTDDYRDLEIGERIAQLIPHYLINLDWVEVDQLNGSDRGNAGFGSTGT